MSYQLDFFQDNSEMGLLRQDILSLRNSLERQRKRQFSLINNFGKELMNLKEEVCLLRSLSKTKDKTK